MDTFYTIVSPWVKEVSLMVVGFVVGYLFNSTRQIKDPWDENHRLEQSPKTSSFQKSGMDCVVKHATPIELYNDLPFLKLSEKCEKDSNHNVDYFLTKIKEYSVNTNHKYFLNQLFGPSDQYQGLSRKCDAFLSEMNTSVYTFETAPVLTLIEHEVIHYFQRILRWHNRGDGIFLPGGSLSNLMALHVARNFSLRGLRNNDEEKKDDRSSFLNASSKASVALVSSLAHYSFAKSANIANLKLILIKCDPFGIMDIQHLHDLCLELGEQVCFIGATSGSTVVGSFDNLNAIYTTINNIYQGNPRRPWLHCDGAWGGNVLLSDTHNHLLDGVELFDSFTLNAHKMLGATQQCTLFLTRHENVLTEVNSCRAEYLFSSRKLGAKYDLGDKTFTCGRRGDALKYWLLLKCHGHKRLGLRVDHNAKLIQHLYKLIIPTPYSSLSNNYNQISKVKEHFLLACPQQPFNINFYYLPPRLITPIISCAEECISIQDINKSILEGKKLPLPRKIVRDLDEVQIKLKLELHKSGLVLLPYQPMSCAIIEETETIETAHCLRIVLAGAREDASSYSYTTEKDMTNLLDIIHSHGQML